MSLSKYNITIFFNFIILSILNGCHSYATVQSLNEANGIFGLYIFDEVTKNGIIRDLVGNCDIGADEKVEIMILSDKDSGIWFSKFRSYAKTINPYPLQKLSKSEEFSFQLWIKVDVNRMNNVGHDSRIITFSKGVICPRDVYFSLIQNREGLAIRMKDSPFLTCDEITINIPVKLEPNGLILLTFTYSNGIKKLYLNEDTLYDSSIVNDNSNRNYSLSNWMDDLYMTIGNEVTLDKQWFGGITMLAIYNKSLSNEDISTVYKDLTSMQKEVNINTVQSIANPYSRFQSGTSEYDGTGKRNTDGNGKENEISGSTFNREKNFNPNGNNWGGDDDDDNDYQTSLGYSGSSTSTSTSSTGSGSSDSSSVVPNGCTFGAEGFRLFNATIRDFKSTHPDFESTVGIENGIIKPFLDSNRKPIYNINQTSTTTSGMNYFNQWYRSNHSVNFELHPMLQFQKSPAHQKCVYRYLDDSFFPIDGEGFGNEDRNHNYHFTMEIHTVFTYDSTSNNTLNFYGDDDLWIFVDNKLVVDLGGVHSLQSKSVNLSQLNLTHGECYSFDIFFAERHTSHSKILLEVPCSLKHCICLDNNGFCMNAESCLLNGSLSSTTGSVSTGSIGTTDTGTTGRLPFHSFYYL